MSHATPAAERTSQVWGKAVYLAAEAGSAGALRALLDAGAPVGTAQMDHGGHTALHAACSGGHADCVALLLERGAYMAAFDAEETPAVCALVGDHAACLRLLLERGFCFNGEEGSGFVKAAAEGAVACMEELLRHDGDPRTAVRLRSGTATTALVAACQRGQTRAAEWLCSRLVDVSQSQSQSQLADVSQSHEAALMAACQFGSEGCVRVLLQHGADLELRDSLGDTALLVALRHAQASCAALLLDHGACPNAANKLGVTPLCWAAATREPREPSRASSAIEEVGGGDDDGTDAAPTSCSALIPRLLAAGAVVDASDNDGRTPLMDAAASGSAFAVRTLCAHRAGLHALDIKGDAVLFSASILGFSGDGDLAQSNDCIACVDELIERGADLLAEDSDGGETPLVYGLITACVDELQGGDYGEGMRLAAEGQLAQMLAWWPLNAPLPAYDGVVALLPMALQLAQRRAEVLRTGRDDAQQQHRMTAAFLRHVQSACGGAVSAAFAPFARFRFVAAGVLERAWAWERRVHRFSAERVALCRAALQVATDAEAAAAERCVPLLREAATSGGADAVGSSETEKQLYAAVWAAGRWGEIRAAVLRAERDVDSAEAALGAAVVEAEAAAQRLRIANEAEERRRAGAGGRHG